jgi:isoleucyl-tRNA synthetase
MLGNLYDFNSEKDAVSYDSMPEIDRFALHRLQEVIERTLKAYDTYEFHIIYHTLYNYCIVDLSAFYLDILKDRLYTSPPESSGRRSAQTVIHVLLDTMARLMAPILSFTAEEIWSHMPRSDRNEPSVHLTSLPQVTEAWKNQELAKKWKRILDVRGDVTKALEEARVKKLIGHSLDAVVTLYTDNNLYETLFPYESELSSIFIVSGASLVNGKKSAGAFESQDIDNLWILVEPATGDKCERCWIYDASIGTSSEHPTICRRCLNSLKELNPNVA